MLALFGDKPLLTFRLQSSWGQEGLVKDIVTSVYNLEYVDHSVLITL